MKKKPESKTHVTAEDRCARLEKRVSTLADRCLYLERVIRIIGLEFEKQHLTESAARDWAARANHLHHAMSAVRRSINRYGNEFDRQPHFTDPGWDIGHCEEFTTGEGGEEA